MAMIASLTSCRDDVEPMFDDAMSEFNSSDFAGTYRTQAEEGVRVDFIWVHNGDASRWDLTARHEGRVLTQTWIVDGRRETFCARLEEPGQSDGIDGRCAETSMASRSDAFLGLDGFDAPNAFVGGTSSREIAGIDVTCWTLEAELPPGVEPWTQCHAEDGTLLFADGAIVQALCQAFQFKLGEAGFEPELVLDTSFIRSFEAVTVDPRPDELDFEPPYPVVDDASD